jgi:fluoride exporter
MTFNNINIVAVGLGGSIGAISRFYVGTIVAKYFPHELPLATLGVNVIGSFIIGLLVGLFLTLTPPEYVKGFLITGFLGALTTYSTFAIESFVLLNDHFWYGVLNIVLNVIGTIFAVMIGYKLITHFIH